MHGFAKLDIGLLTSNKWDEKDVDILAYTGSFIGCYPTAY